MIKTSCLILDKEKMRYIGQEDIPCITGFFIAGQGIGDIMCMIPTILKVAHVLNKKLDVWTLRPYVFKNIEAINAIQFNPDEMRAYCEEGKKLIVCPVQRDNQPKQGEMSLFDHAAMNIIELDESEKQYHLIASKEDAKRAQEILSYFPEGVRVVIHPATNHAVRTWPQKRWQELTRRLLDDGYIVISVGKDTKNIKNARDTVNKIVQPMNIEHEHFIDLTNKLTLHQLQQVLECCDVVVTVDSGILHVAQTTNIFILGIFTIVAPEFRYCSEKLRPQEKRKSVYASCEYQFCSSFHGQHRNTCLFTDERNMQCLPSVEQVYRVIEEYVLQGKDRVHV